MKIEYKPVAVRQIKKLPKREVIKIIRKIGLLAQDPFCGKALKGELDGLRPLRTWPYRIIYETDGEMITIYSVAHRQEVYR